MRWALGNDKPLELAGQGTKRTIGRPSQTDLTLDLSDLTGVTLYEPAELVLSARAGTPLAEIEALLEKNNQELAFEPMDYGPLLGGEANRGTLGGAIAANLSGPRRIKSGAARDHFLGITAVTGRGETIKSGGRVVKNVTGYDLCKLLAGSWGTLAAMTDITVKVLPKARPRPPSWSLVSMTRAPARQWRRRWDRRATSRARRTCPTMSLPGSTACPKTGGLHRAAAGRVCTFSRAPQGGARRADEKLWAGDACSMKKIRAPSGAAFGTSSLSSRRQRERGRFGAFLLRPSRGHEIAAAITPAAQMFYDWAGGLVWVAMPSWMSPTRRIRSAVGCGRWPCHADSRARGGSRRSRRIRAGGPRLARSRQAREGEFRSQGRA